MPLLLITSIMPTIVDSLSAYIGKIMTGHCVSMSTSLLKY